MRLSMYLSVVCTLGMAALPAMAENPAEPGKDKTETPAAQPTTLSPDGLPAEWLQGTPVKNWEPGKTYLLEFWATWCGPCLAQIPHLNELHQEMPDSDTFQIVGINVFDKSTPKVLKNFLANRKSSPTYTIGADTKGQSAALWLKPLGVDGIPFSRIVKDGKILWKGHPNQLNKELIQNIIDGKPAPRPRDTSEEQRAFRATAQSIAQAYADGDYQSGEQKLNEALKQKDLSDDNKLMLLRIPFTQLLQAGQYDMVRTALDRIPQELPENPYALMNYAHMIITTYEIPTDKKNLKGAEEAILKATALQKASAKKNYSASLEWSRIAEARLLSGDRKGAIEAQEEAVRQLPLYQHRNNLTK